MERTIPEEILALVRGEEHTVDRIGLSGSAVLMYPRYVLKIQPHLAEAENECLVARLLAGRTAGRLPVPEIAAYVVEDGLAYTLMSRLGGRMLCSDEYLTDPDRLVRLAAEALRMLWEVDVTGFPSSVSRLGERLRAAEHNVERGLVDVDAVEPETFGSGGFASPEALLRWLCDNRPDEDLVFTHGDFCLPNILADGDRISGFIDLGKAGPADRWQDLAICHRSLRHNFDGTYTGGVTFPGLDADRLFRELGVPCDAEKLRYYILLDELF